MPERYFCPWSISGGDLPVPRHCLRQSGFSGPLQSPVVASRACASLSREVSNRGMRQMILSLWVLLLTVCLWAQPSSTNRRTPGTHFPREVQRPTPSASRGDNLQCAYWMRERKLGRLSTVLISSSPLHIPPPCPLG